MVLYAAAGCHLCERARAILVEVRTEVAFALDEVDITGDPELEARYREWLPVVELDGERISVYRIEEAELRRAVARPGG